MSDRVTSEIGPWAMVPVWVLGVGLKGAELAVYVSLRSFADRQGDARPHVKTIAERAGVSERTAERAITRMRELQLITTIRRYRADGSISGCDYQVRDLPVSPGTDARVATPPTGMSPPPDGDVGARTHQENTPENTPNTSTAAPADADGAPDGGLFDLDDEPTTGTVQDPVQILVGAYVQAVEADGGIATTSQRSAIGANVKRLIKDDDIPLPVLLVAVQRAGARRQRTVDPFLGEVHARFRTNETSRKAMFDRWDEIAATIDDRRTA